MTFTSPFRAQFTADEALSDAARLLEASASPGVDFSAYESSSLFVVVTDDADAVVGAARIIMPGLAGFKTLDTVGRYPTTLDLPRTWDIASFTVRSEQHNLVAAALCHVILQAVRVNRVRSLVFTLDKSTRETFATWGLLPAPIGRSETAFWGQVSRLIDRQRAACWEGYQLVTRGDALEGGVKVPTPGDLEIRVSPRSGLSWGRLLAPTG